MNENTKYTMFASYHEAALEYADGNMAVYGRLMFILNSYGIDNIELDDLSPAEKLFFKAVKPNIDQSVKCSQAGKKGKEKALENKTKSVENNSSTLASPLTTPPSMEKEEEKEEEKEMDKDVEREIDDNSLTLTPQPEEYAKNIYEIWEENGLPGHTNNFLTFLQTDFKQSLQKLRGVHSDSVIQACRNYISTINNPNCYYRFRFSFPKFVESSKFSDFLPENYALQNFLKFGVDIKAAAPPPPKIKIKAHPENCPKCNALLEKSMVLSGYSTWKCPDCPMGWYEYINDEWQWQE